MVDVTEEFVGYWTQHQADVQRYVFKLVPCTADVDDILQLTATGLWRKFDQYDRQRPFIGWAIRFAYIEVLAWRQRQMRDRLVFSDETLALVADTIAEEMPVMELRRMSLDRCLEKLPLKDRNLIYSRYRQQASVKQLAEDQGVSGHKLYYRIEKLRGMLMDCIERSIANQGWQNG
ncbi:RNA polymerase sigma factor [Novipirellula aureliae]|uniref:RNA polymerase sigma factor n=1 Tax=Novipirellula aureliae TaxID=2527966 RepID=A0A5C6E749_9BACT|nr:sigma-70 family RNA polymerase sigma factor [Novipirellula aureliae]TWU44385.1 RNA polymerase sigma factor [Novipirellula aureliae]